MAEGAPLLREYGVKNSIEGSNPSLPATAMPSWNSVRAGTRSATVADRNVMSTPATRPDIDSLPAILSDVRRPVQNDPVFAKLLSASLMVFSSR